MRYRVLVNCKIPDIENFIDGRDNTDLLLPGDIRDAPGNAFPGNHHKYNSRAPYYAKCGQLSDRYRYRQAPAPVVRSSQIHCSRIHHKLLSDAV